jgi:insulysin
MIKPAIDPRTYRVVRLTNNLEALLISDLNTTKCSASMSLGVGTFQDDDDTYGLAHFFEHMLFLGSKSFPSPSIFDNHLSEYFGSTNAFTEEEKTIFYFDIGWKGFDTAIHMFSRMFAEPLLDYSLMNKEIEAVSSENDKNLNNDNWRQHQLIRSLANPHHPFSKFGTGNKATLGSIEGQILHQKIKNFYKKYYVPENMKLVVQGNVEIDSLQEVVTKYFSDIRLDTLQREPEMKYGEINTKESAFNKENLGKIVFFKKLSSSISLDFIFIMEELNSKYKTKPYDYISYMIKYSAENSFVNYLKKLKWVTSMNAGIINSFTSFSEYAITLTLTEEGFKNVDTIIELVYGYLAMIRNKGVSPSIYKEISTIYENNFRFMQKQSDYGKYMSNLASNMFDYEYKDILFGDYCHTNYNETMIMSFMDGLVVENSLIFIGSPSMPNEAIKDKFFKNSTNKTEKWYGTLYMEKKLDDVQIVAYSKVSNELNNYFILRPTNKFITFEQQNLNCTSKDCFTSYDKIIPSLYYETDSIKIWHKVRI